MEQPPEFKVGDVVYNDHSEAPNVAPSFHWDKSVGVVIELPRDVYPYYGVMFGPNDIGIDKWGIQPKYLRLATPEEARSFNFIRAIKGF